MRANARQINISAVYHIHILGITNLIRHKNYQSPINIKQEYVRNEFMHAKVEYTRDAEKGKITPVLQSTLQKYTAVTCS